jgi:hypothetical protein
MHLKHKQWAVFEAAHCAVGLLYLSREIIVHRGLSANPKKGLARSSRRKLKQKLKLLTISAILSTIGALMLRSAAAKGGQS